MITKPEKIIKRIIKAIGQRQSVLLVGTWSEDLIKGIKENQNSLTQQVESKLLLEDNSFTGIIADFNFSVINNEDVFFSEARKLLLPTGILVISANCEEGIFDKITNFFKRKSVNESINKIKPKKLQDLIHDNGFLIDGYYGYPGSHLLMMAQIINKEVTTLFSSEEQVTILNKAGV